MQIERQIKITYRWSKDDSSEIKTNHQEALDESAQSRIFEMMQQGYTSGELHDNVRMDDEDGEDGVEYSGWFEVSTETL